MQKDLDTLTKWSEIWLLKFHPEKCFNLTIGIGKGEESSYHMMIGNVKHKMTKIEEIKDIGVIIDSNLKFEKHINAKIVTANKIQDIIRGTYMFLNKEIFYKALVCSHFDYAMSIWNPHMIKFIESIEIVQRRATKLIPKIKNLTYPERLKALNLPTLLYRRIRGDMIEVYKIISNIYALEDELLELCTHHKLIIADYEKYGRTSNQFTYVSDAHSTTSWLDHIICSFDFYSIISDLFILDKLPSSDHLPLCCTCRFELDLE